MTFNPSISNNLQDYIRTLTEHSGVYRMLNAKGQVLYVGKARNLRKRVSSYFRDSNQLEAKTRALVRHIAKIEVTVTQSENEALLLENALIKKYMPKYNVLLRDDKSYPYIHITDHPHFPRLEFRRGRKLTGGEYFGPYLNSNAARESLNLLHKTFHLRQCNDSFFSNRSRPCLQYQLQRCSAPCVGFITEKDYANDVDATRLFLQGKNQQVINKLVKKMQAASGEQDYEIATVYRDQIASLRHVQTQQYITTGDNDCDIVALVQQAGHACVQLLVVRGGQLLGNREFFFHIPFEQSPGEILESVMEQHYLNRENLNAIPSSIIVNYPLPEKEWLLSVMNANKKHKTKIISKPQSEQAKLLALAIENAKETLLSRLASALHKQEQWLALQSWLNLSELTRVECFDASHTQGEATVVSCVVFTDKGADRKAYRRFNIDMSEIAPGDDYAALTQALTRRYQRLKENDLPFPEVVIIDGGKGQLHAAEKVFTELQQFPFVLMSIAKGPSRKPGLEEIWFRHKKLPERLPSDSPILHELQQIRDEAHRFAITGHKKQRAKKRVTSILESIPGVGKKRRQELLLAFGGLVELKRTSAEEIAKVPGVSLELAKRIYEALR